MGPRARAAEGLLATARSPAPDAALRDEAAEAEIGRRHRGGAGAALVARRGGRRAGAGARRARIDGLDGAARPRRPHGAPGPSSDGEPTATVPIPGGSVEIRAGDLVDREAEARKARRRARARCEQEIARAEAQARQRGLRRQGAAATSCRPSATSSSACARELEATVSAAGPTPRRERYLLSLELFGMRFGLDRMRRLMTALGSPQERFGSIHVVGHERQVLDGADDRRDPRPPRPAHRRLPLAAPRLVQRAHPHRRRATSTQDRFAAAVAARGARGREGRPHARGGRPGHAVRGR